MTNDNHTIQKPISSRSIYEPLVLVDKIQTQLECLYGIGVPHRVVDYLINEKEALNFLEESSTIKLPKELLLVRQPQDDTVEVALFLSKSLLENLSNNSPFNGLNPTNLSDFCIMIEGVSHFVYFLFKAMLKFPITQLEMELQAEIDKFVMLLLFLKSDDNPDYCQELFENLFENYRLIEGLSPEQKGRYITASQLASRYCRKLQRRFDLSENIQPLIEEIRQFYIYSQEQKISHINI